MFRKEAAPIRHNTGDIKTNVDLILSTEASSSLPSSIPIMTSNPAIVYSGDVLPRGRLLESWERTRHSKPVHWFIECFAESVSRNNKPQKRVSYRYLQMGVFLYTWAGMKRSYELPVLSKLMPMSHRCRSDGGICYWKYIGAGGCWL